MDVKKLAVVVVLPARKVVAPAPDWYGTCPTVPAARFVAVVAVVALPASAPTNVVEVTLASPANVVTADPKATEVEPMVTELLTNPALGRPVALVRTSAVGVPNAGVTRIGLVDRTTLPLPVEVVVPVPPNPTPSVPVIEEAANVWPPANTIEPVIVPPDLLSSVVNSAAVSDSAIRRVPAAQLTAALALDERDTVVRVNVLPVPQVPIPVSKPEPSGLPLASTPSA